MRHAEWSDLTIGREHCSASDPAANNVLDADDFNISMLFDSTPLPEDMFATFDVCDSDSTVRGITDDMFTAFDAGTADIPVNVSDTPADNHVDLPSYGKVKRAPRTGWPPEHPVGTAARSAAITRIVRLHNTYHVSNDVLEKVILTVKGHGCQPGDTRYLPPCSQCQASTDHTIRHHHTPGVSVERLKDIKPGQRWMIDGGHATVRSRWGSHMYFMVAVDCKTGYVVVYYLVDNSAKSFTQFVRYLINLTRLRCNCEPTELYGDYFSTHLSMTVTQLRAQTGITFTSAPPHMHHLNPYAEGLMRILKIGCVRRLPALVGKRIYSETITEPREFWPWAMEHKVQSYNLQPNSMVERDSGEITTPFAEFDSKTSDDVVNNLQPFGSNVIVIMQPNQRRSAMDSPTWRATYLFSGSMNPVHAHLRQRTPRTCRRERDRPAADHRPSHLPRCQRPAGQRSSRHRARPDHQARCA